MSDVTVTAAVCVGAGAIVSPFCEVFGFEPTLLVGGLVGGFIGCLIVQTLIPEKPDARMRGVLAQTIGSVLLAAILTLVFSPWVIRTLSLTDVPPGAVRLMVGTAIGACAQPLAFMLKRSLLKRLSGSLGEKENGNA